MNTVDPSIYQNLELLPENIVGWQGTKPIFRDLILSLRPRTIIEVGTWYGQSAITMGRAVKELGLPTNIICVDTWLGAIEFWDDMAHTPERNLLQKNGYPQAYYQFLSNVVHQGLQDVILPFPNTSLIAGRYMKKHAIEADMIYIDASHDYEDVKMDLKTYWPLVSSGGVMFGDDYTWPDVAQAVNEFAESNKLKRELVGGVFWILRKP